MKGSVRPLWWLPVACLLCSVALAAKKSAECSLRFGTDSSSEYAAALKVLRFVPSEEQKTAVESLFGQLKERHITIKPTLYNLLARADPEQLIPLCQKTALFFSQVDNSCVKNSGCLSSMIGSKKHVRDFIAHETADLAKLTASPYFSSVTGMCNNRGVPSGDMVKNLFSWPVWQVNEQFRPDLFRAVSSMFSGKGLPKEAEVKALFSWPVWQLNGQFNYEIFRSFSGMFNGKKLPNEAEVQAILSWSCWQVGGQFNYELFRSFSGMFNGRGMPIEADVKAILSWSCWLVGGQFNHDLFRSFSCMLKRKGLPNEAEVKAILSWSCWQLNGEFNHKLFRSCSGMLHGKGLPKRLMCGRFWRSRVGHDRMTFTSVSLGSPLLQNIPENERKSS